MIEHIAQKIDPRLLPKNGRVFYSGRSAFSSPHEIYIIGYNPGGDPGSHANETVESHNNYVLSEAPAKWSAYCDESWTDRKTGEAPLQRRVKHLLSTLQFDPRLVPSSNLVFLRSSRASDLAMSIDMLIDLCWPVHQAVLDHIKPRAIICLGVDTAQKFRKRVDATHPIGIFEEMNNRGWRSHAWRSPSGMLVFGLTHPGRADWTNPASDPSAMVNALLEKHNTG